MSHRRSKLPLALAGGVAALLLVGGLMVWRADARTNKVALASRPKPVTVVRARAAMYRPSRTYVGTLEPWVQANVGPAARLGLRRHGPRPPGRDRQAGRGARDARLPQRQRLHQGRRDAGARARRPPEGGRTRGGADAGAARRRFRLAERGRAEDGAEHRRGGAGRVRAREAGAQLARGQRLHPARAVRRRGRAAIDRSGRLRTAGNAIVSVVDRSTVRMTADAPEIDFDVVAAGTKVLRPRRCDEPKLPGDHHPSRAGRRSGDAHRPLRDRPRRSDPSHPGRHDGRGPHRRRSARSGDGDPALRGDRARRARRTCSSSTATSRIRGPSLSKAKPEARCFSIPRSRPETLVVTEGRALLDDGDRVDAEGGSSDTARRGSASDDRPRRSATRSPS